MIQDEPIAWLRLTNQALAIAILVVIAAIGWRHAFTRKFSKRGGLVVMLLVLFAIRLTLATWGDTGVQIFGDAWRILSNSVSMSILLILVSYLIYDITSESPPIRGIPK